ncbi:Uncharacterised protein [Mycobacterium tuberculosis]|uniref:Uncharacterized protein n=1 Tax=Mycobacterium tuberculosis TaxID=1773 RepID=A0A655ACP6_MYCTX|nr:Uncharacterised protein [Mycobacterium tuberculosis]CFR93566.1 Uncharacterised protein [Mycobacterium tuberculosis]CFS19927.1 Uncharacterised protein [Mycobacterium tuberculosis]CKS42203.1 Uncharacterised protein [Mycobacterium tuberculosis]CKS53140.1 Uncharacterised protein [Mycobacterium tuberculosis]
MCDRADPLLLPRDQRGCHGLTRHRPVSQHSNSQLSRALSQRGPSGVVSAHHQRTPGDNALHEGVEHRNIRLDAAVEVQVIGLDVGDHRDVGCVLQQRAIAFVGFGDETVATAVMGVGTGLPQLTADRKGRVKPAVLQGDDQHGRRRCLAVRAGDHQCGAPGHQLGQHGRPQHHGNAAAPRFDELGVGFGDGGMGSDDRRGATGQQVQRRRVVSDPDQRAPRPQRMHTARLLGV